MADERLLNECPHCSCHIEHFDDAYETEVVYQGECPKCNEPVVFDLDYEVTYFVSKPKPKEDKSRA